MPAAMLTEVAVLDRGTHATGTVGIGGTAVPVEDLTQFDEDGGTLDICGIQYDYTAIDEVALTITLPTTLTVAVAEFDPVLVVAGGQVSRTYTAILDMGEGDTVTVDIPYDRRAQLPEGLYDPAVPVIVSPDLTQIIDIPGRQPVIAGSAVDPTGLQLPLPDEAPATSPSLEAHGMPSSIVLVADNVEQTTEIEYHVSTSSFSPVAGDPATLITTTRSNVLVVTELPSGVLLKLDTPYYFHAIAVNIIGAASPSAEVSSKLDPTAVATVVATKIVAGFVLAGLIQVGNITIDPNSGIQIPLANNGSISLPADGSAASFKGVLLEAASLVVYDNFELRGALNRIAGTLALASAPTTPTVLPGVVAVWDPTAHAFTTAAPGTNGLWDDGTNWVTTGAITGGPSVDSGIVIGLNKTTGAKTTLLDETSTQWYVQSVAKSGSNWYVLSAFNTGPTTIYRVREYNASWVWTGNVFTPGAVANSYPVQIASDGSALFIAYYRAFSDNKVVVNSMTTSGGSATTVLTTPDTFPNSISPIPLLWVGSADFSLSFSSTRRFILGTGISLRVYDNGSNSVAAEQWIGPLSETPGGLYWDGANFRMITSQSRVWKMSNVPTTTARSVRWAQYDSVGTQYETPWSSPVSFSHLARRWMKVSTPPPAYSGGADDPNAIRHYIQSGGSGSYYLQPNVTAAPWSALYGIPAAVTAGPTALSPFPVVNPGVLQSSSGSLYIKGDNSFALGPFSADASGVVTGIGTSQQATQSADVTVTSTANSTLTGVSVTITASGPNDVYMVDLDPDVIVTTSGTATLNTVELLVDGSAQAAIILTQLSIAGSIRIAGHKRYRITGLAAGSHTFTARTRNSAPSTSATVKATNTTITVERIA